MIVEKWNDIEKKLEISTEQMGIFFNDLKKVKIIKINQLERFHKYLKTNDFYFIINKIINKYNSDKYINNWYSRGIGPPEYLYWFLFYYSKKYGRECNDKEWKKYGNMFTLELFYINGYYFNKMFGQGSCILIMKSDRIEKLKRILDV